MEGYYGLATPYFAADPTMQHMNLAEEYQKNISSRLTNRVTWCTCAHRLEKMKEDFANFIDETNRQISKSRLETLYAFRSLKCGPGAAVSPFFCSEFRGMMSQHSE